MSKLEKMAKKLVSGLILAHLAQFRAANFFFFKNLASSVTRYHSYHHVQYQKKTNDPILRKRSDGHTDGRTDGQADESDFIGRCPANVDRPTSY